MKMKLTHVLHLDVMHYIHNRRLHLYQHLEPTTIVQLQYAFATQHNAMDEDLVQPVRSPRKFQYSFISFESKLRTADIKK